ncbi:hypothetical protein VNI00_013656 [Paramarasmius palmivorus]|uniref:Crinkler (CRN) family protein n=1 Tax=Paramarasmius palmivorus TaxID=297713 RepID=A0AAW0BX92_9AGAR
MSTILDPTIWSKARQGTQLKYWEKCWGKADPKDVVQVPAEVTVISKEGVESAPPEVEPILSAADLLAFKAGTTFPVMGSARLFVRQEYQIMMAKLSNQSHRTPITPLMDRRRGTMITGHPGIGKTAFRKFILYHRCVEQKPTLFYDGTDSKLYYFSEEGVDCAKVDSRFEKEHIKRFPASTWLLLDGAEHESIPPVLTAGRPVRANIVFTSSPQGAKRFHAWGDKTLDTETLYMRGWSDQELQNGCFLHGVSWRVAQERMLDIGRVPRNIFLTSSYSYMLQRIRDKFSSICVAGPQMFQDPETLHCFIYESPEPGSEASTTTCKVLLSPYVLCELRTRALKQEVKNREWMMLFFSHISRGGSVVGRHLYEIDIIAQLAAVKVGETLPQTMYKMTRNVGIPAKRKGGSALDAGKGNGARKKARREAESPTLPTTLAGPSSEARGRKKHEPRWYSAFARDTHLRMSRNRVEAQEQPLMWQFKGMEHIDYPVGRPKLAVQPNRLYVPEASNEPGLDCFYVVDGTLTLLQMTTAPTQNLSAAIRRLHQRFDKLPALEYWRIIFVQPDWRQLAVPYEEKLSCIPLFHTVITATGFVLKDIPLEKGEDEDEDEVDEVDEAEVEEDEEEEKEEETSG